MRKTAPDIDAVGSLIDEVSQTVILPQFRRLRPGDIERKNSADPDDLVTVVDRQVEEWLTERLTDLTPGIPVVGEEAAYHRPDLLNWIQSDDPFWLLDPIDGTKNFARGDDGFGVMLAWVVQGQARAAWVVVPARKQSFVAEAGSGALFNGARIITTSAPFPDQWRGNLVTRWMPDALRESVKENLRGRFQAAPETGCSAIEYTSILQGEREFTIYYRLLSWDHVAPAFILTEGGGCVEHLDGKPYTARSGNQVTVVARAPSASARVRDWLKSEGGSR